MDSALAEQHRLVAVDMRGHGRSDRPRDGYGDAKLWADDLQAVIEALQLDRPVLCCWSYGPFVLDYLRHYGDEAIGGVVLVSAISKLGSDEAVAVLNPELLELVPGLFSTDVDESMRTLTAFVRLCFADQLSDAELYLMLGYNASVSPSVRQALFSRVVDNDDVLARIRKPVLLVHAADDAVVKAAVVDQHKARVPHAQVELMPHGGHAPFWNEVATFNRLLQTFVANASGESAKAAARHAS